VALEFLFGTGFTFMLLYDVVSTEKIMQPYEKWPEGDLKGYARGVYFPLSYCFILIEDVHSAGFLEVGTSNRQTLVSPGKHSFSDHLISGWVSQCYSIECDRSFYYGLFCVFMIRVSQYTISLRTEHPLLSNLNIVAWRLPEILSGGLVYSFIYFFVQLLT
jgi:hypothetical protein